MLRSSAALYSAKAFMLFLISLIVISPLLVVVYLLTVALAFVSDSLNPTIVLWLRVSFLALFFLFMLATIVSTGALIVYITRSFRREKVNTVQAYQMTLKRFPEFLKVNIFYGLKVALGGILLVLPGIYFGIIHAFAPLLVLVEGLPTKEAMARSRQMIKPRLIPYTDYLFFAAIAALVSCIPFLVLLNYLIDWSMLYNHWRLAAAADFATMCVALMAVQFIMVFYVRLYEELKAQSS